MKGWLKFHILLSIQFVRFEETVEEKNWKKNINPTIRVFLM
jgi:hypothetical protein